MHKESLAMDIVSWENNVTYGYVQFMPCTPHCNAETL